MLLAFHKPCNVLTQFTPDIPGQRTLAEFGFPPRVYPLGRLDYDSEGLLLLSDEAGLNTRLLDPKNAHLRSYWAQVEGAATVEMLRPLSKGVLIQGKKTLPAQAKVIPEPDLPPRDPPIRSRQNIPTSWVEVSLHEGRNRQVRRMTAAVGLPTLRLVRARIGQFSLPPELAPGTWREVTASERKLIFT
jgi:23S rRNA pseudouridine2457 synthase